MSKVSSSTVHETHFTSLQRGAAGLAIGLPAGWLCALGWLAGGYPVAPEVIVPLWMVAGSCLGAGVGAWARPGGGASRPEFFCLVIGVILGTLSGCTSGPVWRVLVPDGHLGEFGPAARTVFGFSAGVVGGGLIGLAVGWLLGSRCAFVWRYGHRRLILVDPFLDPNELNRRAGL